MGYRTIYGAQPFWYDGRRLVPGHAEQFATVREAARAARRLYENHAGVTLLSVSGNPEFDYWSEPRVLATLGTVPR